MSALRLAVIVGSTRDGRFGPTAAHWFAQQARSHSDFEIDVIDLVDAQLPTTITDFGAPEPAEVTALAPRLAEADAFVIVTPEYNHSYPASLKVAIDWYRDEWQAKPVGFVSYGGMGGGLRAVEHLRTVFTEVHATTVRDTISFHSYWDKFDEEGLPHDGESCAHAAKGMLDQLSWWGGALKDARARAPYGG
ncbi:NADPH-dependent FMN reductase [Hoyosella subflava]|uniref:UrdO n=1 Tax=Hoyosella subflava (strain DSM 45089 / JCM 17490 / NBRC 109087 / DQS3-9A1) TaxID=443218 RepID=F6EN50_HOYSD|nr:NAD(P)H-dependent oxidoreductase [Hoyosella subflava]AEF39367.1 UrdO [Hoyosella subflava DQS3-9A1]